MIPVSKRDHRSRQPKGPRRRAAARRAADNHGRRGPDLLDEVADALATGEPLGLLWLASSFLDAVDPPEHVAFDRREEPALPPREAIIQTFVEVPLPETSALLAAIAGVSGDDMLRSRVRGSSPTEGTCSPAGSWSWVRRGRMLARSRWRTSSGTATTWCSG